MSHATHGFYLYQNSKRILDKDLMMEEKMKHIDKLFKYLFTLTLLSVLVINSSQISNAQSEVLIRDTLYGQVQGYEEEGAYIWKGIPYGGDTSGENRWKAPVDPEPWNEILEANESGDIAIQASGDGVVGSEDALNLDIYRPANDAEGLPVMLFIHGGNNQTGKAEEISGSSFVQNHDAIIVSINYRLGALGFNPLEALKTGTPEENSGNYTLLDILKSLDWLANNIENFGGDANNITVAGFSAGGRDVMAMLSSPIFEGKFQKAISFSGGLTFADESASQTVFAKAISTLVVEDGIKDSEEAIEWLLTDDEEVRDYLMDLEADRLVSLMSNASIRMSVFPHLYTDGTVLPEDGIENTSYNNVPTILVSGTNEFSLFGRFDPYFAEAIADDSINTDESIKAQYDFINKYGGELYGLANLDEPASKLSDDANDSVYVMQIEYGTKQEVVPEEMSVFGAFHGVFVPLLDTNNQNYTALIGEDAYSSNGAQALSDGFQKYIYQFMKNGDPNDGELTEWATYTSNEANLLVADATQGDAIFEMRQREYDYDDVLVAIEEDDSISDEEKEELILSVLNGRWFSYTLDKLYNNLSEFYQ